MSIHPSRSAMKSAAALCMLLAMSLGNSTVLQAAPLPDNLWFAQEKSENFPLLPANASNSKARSLQFATASSPKVINSPIPRTISVPNSNQNVSNDAAQNYETSVTSIDLNGQTYVATAFISQQAVTLPGSVAPYFKRINVRSTTPNGSIVAATPVAPSGYVHTVDPYLAVNPYTDGAPNTPLAIFLIGLAISDTSNTTLQEKHAIVGWKSTDGCVSWSNPVVLDTCSTFSGGNHMDKPHIAVSWHPKTRGNIYVSYRNCHQDLVMLRTTDGGVTFSAPVVVASGTNPGQNTAPKSINGIQIAVSPGSGKLYAFWSDFDVSHIMNAVSSNLGDSWSTASLFPDSSAQNLVLNLINGGIRATSFPVVRFNYPRSKVSVVWHECSDPVVKSSLAFPSDCIGASHTDVYYAALSSSGSIAKVKMNDDNGVTDQFEPALDYDSSGNLVSTFYDRRNTSGNGYRLYRAYITDVGSPLKPNKDVSLFTTNTYDSPTWQRANFIGDYHEIWNTMINGVNTWISSWTGVASGTTTEDIFMTTINP